MIAAPGPDAPDHTQHASSIIDAFWTLPTSRLMTLLRSSPAGLSRLDADARLQVDGPNLLRERESHSRLRVLARQLQSPLLLLLVFAAVVSALSGERLDAAVVMIIIVTTVGIGYSREYAAHSAAAALRSRLHLRALVTREGRSESVPAETLVAGDVVGLSAGNLVPADGVLLEATDFFVSEAVLTGESFPVQKRPGPVLRSASLAQRTNCLFLGTSVRSGSAHYLVVRTGPRTELGAIAHRLTLDEADTEFDRGVRRFGYLLTVAMLTMVLVVFFAHMVRRRPPVETLLFAVALAVGLSPELLPAILSVNLARGAQAMARRGVLVRRLHAIENLGSMDVLCTDKTGTITEGVIELEGAYDADGQPSDAVLTLAAINATLETGVSSPLDDAIVGATHGDLGDLRKLGEVPFDFVRKRVTVIVENGEGGRLITKGAFHAIADVCSHVADRRPLDEPARGELVRRYEQWTRRGIRVLAVAERPIGRRAGYTRHDEADLTFAGFLTFLDRPRPGATQAIDDLRRLGVSVKMISGDSRLVAVHLAGLVGLRAARVMTGAELDDLHGDALPRAAAQTDLFVETDPRQKERIVVALKQSGRVVGYLGDGINDAPAMHAADTSLSVAEATDVAREAADFVLLERGLDVIRRGIEEGRRTFANTLKYVLITTSANLGNMVSMAVSSLALPFLPLTAGQILLNNLLSDVPAFGLADDRVDPELVDQPRRWDIRFIGRYMLAFGASSSIFDLMTFTVLLVGFRTPPTVFRTGWFVESLLTELGVALVMRTSRPSWKRRPGLLLLYSTLGVMGLALAVPFLPAADTLGFVPIPFPVFVTVVAITILYLLATEAQKRWFYDVDMSRGRRDGAERPRAAT